MSWQEAIAASPEAERLLLGSIVAFPDCAPDVFRKLHARDFVDPAHATIYAAMLDQNARGLAVDPPFLAAELKAHPEFRDGGAAGYLLELGQDVATVVNVDYYAAEIIEASRKRRLQGIAETALEGARNGQPSDTTYRMLLADLDDYRQDAASGNPLMPDLQPVSQFIDQQHSDVEYELSRYEISKRTDIDEGTLSRFMSGERGLSMKALDRLGACLGLTINRRRKPKRTKR
jgi:replicative DNA helicase